MPKGIPNTKPAKPAGAAPLTVEEQIKRLISALGHEPSTVASIDIRPRHIRVLGKDRSLRSHGVQDWTLKKEDDGD